MTDRDHPERPLRLLVVDDSEEDAILLARALRREGYALHWSRVQDGPSMRAALEASWDVIVCDWSMPRFSVPAALALCKELELDVPFIIVSGVVGEETAVEAMRAGAHDYVLKGRFARLGPAIERELADRARRAAAREQLHRAEEQLRQTQKLEAVGRLAGGVAHDFNNLMTVVLTNAGLLARHPSVDDDARGLVDDIAAAGGRAAELARQLLVFGRTQTLQREPLPLSPVVGAATRMLRPIVGSGVSLSTDLSDRAGYVEAHRGQLEQVVMNLVVNGRDAMPDGGELHVATEAVYVEAERATTMGLRTGPYARLSVADTGVGMDEHVRSHIFDPFFTTKASRGGSGLGLSTVYGIVRHAGGVIDVASSPGQGTRFDVYLPQIDPPPTREDEGELTALPRGHETVLLVEPLETLRVALAQTLRELGYQVLECADEGDALSSARDLRRRLDLLMVDAAASRHVDGVALVDRVRELRPAIHALFLSEVPAGGRGGEPGGPRPALAKPFTPAALARRLREVLGGSG